MPEPPAPSRRDFLATTASALGGTWLAAALPAISTLAACARDAAERGEPFTTLTPRRAETMAAVATQIMPSDALPGATEAGAVYFVDRALGGSFAGMRGLIEQGLDDLDARASREDAHFAALPSDKQVAMLREVEQTPFFFNARMLTVMGVLADPKYGGNRDNVGFQLVRRELAPSWQPPFGYYDAQARLASAGGEA